MPTTNALWRSVVVSRECPNRCLSCPQRRVASAGPFPAGAESRAPKLLAEETAQTSAANAPASGVVLVGGDPSNAADLEERIAALRSGGERIALQSNGHNLAQRLQRLADAGLTDLSLSLHAARSAPHDHITQRDGSFDDVRSALGAGRRAGLGLHVFTLLTRSTFRGIAELVPLLQSAGVQTWEIGFPNTAGALEAHFDAVMPRLSLALPYTLHAATQARRAGLKLRLRGMPLCLLGPLATQSVGCPRAYPDACSDCPMKAHCPGVDPVYLARFGPGELRPGAQMQHLPKAPDAPLVGPGPLLQSPPAEVLKRTAGQRDLLHR